MAERKEEPSTTANTYTLNDHPLGLDIDMCPWPGCLRIFHNDGQHIGFDGKPITITPSAPERESARAGERARLLSIGLTEEDAEEDERHDDALEAITRHVKANCECTTKPHCLRRIEHIAHEALTEERS